MFAGALVVAHPLLLIIYLFDMFLTTYTSGPSLLSAILVNDFAACWEWSCK
jgi:hypothetical protein